MAATRLLQKFALNTTVTVKTATSDIITGEIREIGADYVLLGDIPHRPFSLAIAERFIVTIYEGR